MNFYFWQENIAGKNGLQKTRIARLIFLTTRKKTIKELNTQKTSLRSVQNKSENHTKPQ